MISSNLGGRSGLSRKGRKGGRFRMASKITAEVSPRNGMAPVAISYNTAPNEKRSVRASSSFPGVTASRRQFSEPEVQHLGVPPFRDKNIGGLDVTVDDAFAMCGIQRVGDLDGQ